MDYVTASDHNRVESKRKSNIELLRIIAMIMIIGHHVAVHSGFDFATDSITVNRLWVQFIQMGGKLGVDIFILISGYFLISAKKLKISKVIKLLLHIFTYSISIFVVFTALGINDFGFGSLIKSFFPIIFSRWWFATTYFVMFLITPYLNRLFNMLSKTDYIKMLVLLLLLWCVIPTFTAQSMSGSNLLWFIVLYALGGYIRLYVHSSKIKGWQYIMLGLLMIALTFISALVFDFIGLKHQIFADYATFFYSMEKLPIVIATVFLFIGFSRIEIGYVPWINVVASGTFGVYLIHDNSYVRPFLWHKLFNNASYASDSWLILYTIFEIAIVFIVCTGVELLRIHLIEKLYMKSVRCLSSRIELKIQRFTDVISRE